MVNDLRWMIDLNSVRKVIDAYLGLIFRIGLVLVILASFFLFTNLFTEFYDTPKFLVLFIFTGIMLIILTLKYTVSGKVVFLRTSLDIPLLLLLAVGVVSTILSPSPYVALLGNQLQVHGSLVSLVTYVLFYFVLTNALKGVKEVKWIFTFAIIAAQILAVVSLLTYAGFKVLPPSWSQGLNFTPAGSSFSATAILALLLPFIVIRILSASNLVSVTLNSLFLLLTGVTVALTGTWATWLGALTGLVLSVLVMNPLKNLRSVNPIRLIGLIVPVVLVVLVIILSFISPIDNAKNPLYSAAQSFPREIQLDAVSSWKISVSAFRDVPFWGTSPASYLFDFTNYKPVEFNSTKYWNLGFASPFDEYLLVLATLGGVGIIALLSLTALFLSAAYKEILNSFTRTHDNLLISSEKTNSEIKPALAIAGIIFFIILALHASSLPLWVIGTLVLASFMVVSSSSVVQRSWNTASGDFKSMFLRIAANVTSQNPSEETIRADALPGILLAGALALVLFAGYYGGKIALADYHHRLALNGVAQNNGILAYNELVAAEKLNPQNDLYRTDLAQTNFALANAIARAKGPTQASPSGSLTDQDKQNIQVLLSQSIAEGRTATTLSPRSATDWEILALLYRQISGVTQNALVFSLDAYGRAIYQDPLNPSLRLSVGGVYYAIKNYDLAVRFFTDAINLKPDLANGYYNLSVALRDQGHLKEAQQAGEKALSLVDAKSADYKTVNDYLNDLKKKIAAGSTQESASAVQPPAAKTGGALQEKNLPKVVNVGNPPSNIATPSAVKKTNASPEPSPSPTP